MTLACPPTSSAAATSLSGPDPRLPRLTAPRIRWSTLAQSSLWLVLLTMTSTSCLVTSTPDFTPPKPTRPFLIPSSSDPDARAVLLVDTVEHPKSQTSIQFSANIAAGNDGRKVEGVLYIDYGLVTNDMHFREQIPIRDIPPSTQPDLDTRSASGTWNVSASNIGPGCHTVTLLVTHELDHFTSCPTCRNDSSQITWQVFSCGGASAASCVAHLDFSACQKWGQGCDAAVDPDAGDCGALP